MRKISSASHAPCESFMGQDVIRNSEISMETVRKSVREHYEFVILGHSDVISIVAGHA